MKKIIIRISFVFFLCFFLNCSFFTRSKNAQLNAVSVYLNGSKITINTILVKGTLYVPLKEICYYFNCDYKKDDDKKVINFIKSLALKENQGNIERKSNIKKRDIKIENSNYQTFIDDLILFITPIVYDNTFYLPLGYFAESFEKSTKWNLFKNSVSVKDYPEEYVGSVNGEKIKKRFFNERYSSKCERMKSANVKKDKPIKNELTKKQKMKIEEETFNEIVDLILARQKASEYGLVVDENIKNQINYYLSMTVSRFKGIEGFRDTFDKNGITYQDAINYFTYGVIKEALLEKMADEIEPPEEMMRVYYDNSPKTFIKPARVIVKQIMIPTQDKNENSFSSEKIEEQRKLASMILAKIKNGEDFEELNKKYSQDYFPDTKDHPDGFEVEEGSLSIAKVFEDTVFKLKVGEISDVVKTYRGFHIIKLISMTEKKQKTFEESKERIKRDLAYTTKVNYFDESMKKWKEESEIKKHI